MTSTSEAPSPETMDRLALFASSSQRLLDMPSGFDTYSFNVLMQPGGSYEAGENRAGEWQASQLPRLISEHPASAVVLMDVLEGAAPDSYPEDVDISDLKRIALEGGFGNIARSHPDPSDIANVMHTYDQRISKKPRTVQRTRREVLNQAEGLERSAGVAYLDDSQRREAQGAVLNFLYGERKVQAWSQEHGLEDMTARAGQVAGVAVSSVREA